MLFQHLPNLYAKYYLATKQVETIEDPKEKSLALGNLNETKTAYFKALHDFEIYLDVVGNADLEEFEDLYEQIVYDSKNPEKMGTIQAFNNGNWVISWYNRNTLEYLETNERESLEGLKVIPGFD